MENQVNLTDWAEFSDSEFLDAKRVKDNSHKFAITDIGAIADKGQAPRLLLTLSSDEGKLIRKFGLNKTNTRFLEENAKVSSPKELIGKVISFDKVKVNNPKTGSIVDGLYINSVE